MYHIFYCILCRQVILSVQVKLFYYRTKSQGIVYTNRGKYTLLHHKTDTAQHVEMVDLEFRASCVNKVACQSAIVLMKSDYLVPATKPGLTVLNETMEFHNRNRHYWQDATIWDYESRVYNQRRMKFFSIVCVQFTSRL